MFLAAHDPFPTSIFLFLSYFPSLRVIWPFGVRPFSPSLENTHFVTYKNNTTQWQVETYGSCLPLCIKAFTLICLYVSRICRDLEYSSKRCLCGGNTYKWYTYINGIICVESRVENLYITTEVIRLLFVVVAAAVVCRGSTDVFDKNETRFNWWYGCRKSEGEPRPPKIIWRILCPQCLLNGDRKLSMNGPFCQFILPKLAQKMGMVGNRIKICPLLKGKENKGKERRMSIETYVMKFVGYPCKLYIRRKHRVHTAGAGLLGLCTRGVFHEQSINE